jgi:hypothetical protein
VQVLTTIPGNFRLAFPRAVLSLFDLMNMLFNFDFFGLASNFRCLFEADYLSLVSGPTLSTSQPNFLTPFSHSCPSAVCVVLCRTNFIWPDHHSSTCG